MIKIEKYIKYINILNISNKKIILNKMVNSYKIYVLILSGIIILSLGFGIYATVLYAKRNDFKSDNYICGSYENITSMSMSKNILSIWNWKYTSSYGYFEHMCPTFTHDANIYRGNQLAMRTDGKIFTVKSKVNLRDCHGNIKYIMETGSPWETLINKNLIWVKLLLKYPNDTIIAYVSSTIFITGNIEFRNINDTLIASAEKIIEGIHWQWNYKIYSEEIDLSAIIAITAKISFNPSAFDYVNNNKENNDGCNKFFMASWIISIILLGLLFIGGITYCYNNYKKKQNNKNYYCMYT